MDIAKKRKQDEFYTTLDVIEQEMVYYLHYFRDKTIFMNCDDPKYSNSSQYFSLNFNFMGLKRLISTHYNYDNTPSYMVEIIGINDKTGQVEIKSLEEDGDFRSDECIDLLKQSDVVITNPPISINQ